MSPFSTSCFILSETDGKIEQCICIKFCVKLSKSTTKTLEMLLHAFGEHSLSWTVVFEQHSRFKAGRVSSEGDQHSGRPCTSKTTENYPQTKQQLSPTITKSKKGEAHLEFNKEHAHCFSFSM
jgi:hypothetical protein